MAKKRDENGEMITRPGEKGFDTFVSERVKKEGASKLWNHDDDNVWDLFDEAENGEQYLGDDGSSRKSNSAIVGKSGMPQRKLQVGLYGKAIHESRRKPFQLAFRLDGDLKKKLDVVCTTTRQTIGEVLRQGIADSYEKLKEMRKQIIEERATLELMMKEQGTYNAHRVEKALRDKQPWRVAEQRAILEGQRRDRGVQIALNAKRRLTRRRTPLTPEQEEKRAKNMAEIEAKLQKKRDERAATRARRRARENGEGFIPEKRLNPPPEYE